MYKYDQTTGRIVSQADERVMPRPWRLHYDDVFIVKYVEVCSGGAFGSCTPTQNDEPIPTITNPENMFDDKIDSYSEVTVSQSILPGGVVSKYGHIIAYINVPLNMDKIELLVTNESGEVSGGVPIGLRYTDGTSASVSPSSSSTLPIPENDEFVDATLYEYSLDKTKKLLFFDIGTPSASSSTWKANVHALYVYTSGPSSPTTSSYVYVWDSAGTVINPAKEDGNLSTVQKQTDEVGAYDYTATGDMFTASGSEQAYENVTLGDHEWVVRGYVALFGYLDVGGAGTVDIDENGIIELRR